ncbi:hypothetical protein A359_01100 [secondary endosymbiont of Ctenarytaina eucalypti]|uniref:Uncharacterized protein n=1 Tax=secondary endosymbiont of Ctenarytaina eucalypti TaxID=1199245 RepID=J3Z2T4_9ENTR|nr:hypothetical protein A359_01100 [secondary endosymbiont of Ctenarytaina eucalypti]
MLSILSHGGHSLRDGKGCCIVVTSQHCVLLGYIQMNYLHVPHQSSIVQASDFS